MIFKYFSYDKKLKDWLDTKIYCSICVPGQLPKAKELNHMFYKQLMQHKVIAMAPEYFSLQDQSTFPGVRTYTVSHLTASKRTNVGKLTQLPDKVNAANNAKIKDSWNTPNPFKKVPRAPTRDYGFIQGSVIGWDPAPRTVTSTIRGARINMLFRDDVQVAAAPVAPIVPVEMPAPIDALAQEEMLAQFEIDNRALTLPAQPRIANYVGDNDFEPFLDNFEDF